MKTIIKITLVALLVLLPSMVEAQKLPKPKPKLSDTFGRSIGRKSTTSYTTALRGRVASYDWYKAQRRASAPPTRPDLNGSNGSRMAPPRPGGQPISTNRTTVNDLIRKSKAGRETSGRSKQYIKQGGYTQAQKDFTALRPTNVQIKPNGVKVGQLPGNRKAVLRKQSSDKRPTLEIQEDDNTRIKFRYDRTN